MQCRRRNKDDVNDGGSQYSFRYKFIKLLFILTNLTYYCNTNIQYTIYTIIFYTDITFFSDYYICYNKLGYYFFNLKFI